VQLVSYDGGLK